MERRNFVHKLAALAAGPAGGAALFRNAAAADTEYHPANTITAWASRSTSASAAEDALRPAKTRTMFPRSRSSSEPGWRDISSTRTMRRRFRISTRDLRRADNREREVEQVRSFFVPKLCNQCDNPPCVQVCPVSATFKTVDGVILVDEERCIGCRYCIQACPYGARYLHPVRKTADKCTFCYHRTSQGDVASMRGGLSDPGQDISAI